MRLRLLLQKTMKKVSNCVWRSASAIHPIAHNLFRQFWNVTFNKIVCHHSLFLSYETPPQFTPSGIFGWLFWLSSVSSPAQRGERRGARFQAPEQLCLVVPAAWVFFLFQPFIQLQLCICFITQKQYMQRHRQIAVFLLQKEILLVLCQTVLLF